MPRMLMMASVIVLLFAGTVAGAPLPELQVQGTANPLFEAPQPAEALFWRLPVRPAEARTFQVGVEVRIDGRTSFTDAFQARYTPGEDDALVELFATRPDALARHLATLDLGERQVEVRLSLDGREVARTGLDELRSESFLALRGNVRPLPLTYTAPTGPTPVGTGPDVPERLFAASEHQDCTLRNACMDDCWFAYQDCVGQYCNDDDCPICDDDLAACEASCPECECLGPHVYQKTTQTTTGQVVGSTCAPAWYNGPLTNWYFMKYTTTERVTEITEQCDGTKTERLISSTVLHVVYCYINVGGSCWVYPAPYGPPAPRCA